jgi:hypothetical protein
MERAHCYNPPQDCSRENLVLLVHNYDHSQDLSITGRFVSRGKQVPELYGSYIYADYVTGKIWALSSEGNIFNNHLLMESRLHISSFGIDSNNELYI